MNQKGASPFSFLSENLHGFGVDGSGLGRLSFRLVNSGITGGVDDDVRPDSSNNVARRIWILQLELHTVKRSQLDDGHEVFLHLRPDLATPSAEQHHRLLLRPKHPAYTSSSRSH